MLMLSQLHVPWSVNSSAVWNILMDSIAEYWSTPSGCVCQNQAQISVTSSSRMRRHLTECLHPWLIQKGIYNWKGQLLYLEYDLWLLRQSLQKWWTLQWGKGGFVKISMVKSEESTGFHKWWWNWQILGTVNEQRILKIVRYVKGIFKCWMLNWVKIMTSHKLNSANHENM